MEIMGACVEKGISLYTTKEHYSFDNTINSKVLCFAFGLVAEAGERCQNENCTGE